MKVRESSNDGGDDRIHERTPKKGVDREDETVHLPNGIPDRISLVVFVDSGR
jgi:hypothetical protein